MKQRLYYLIFIFCLSFSVIGQNYTPLPTDTTTFWRESEQYYTSSSTGYCYDYHYQVSGDTTINGMQYHSLHKYGIERDMYSTACGSFLNIIDEHAGYFRNDSVNKKVWYYNPSLGISQDTLLYDFSLDIGDTLGDTYISYSLDALVVDSVDTISINNRTLRRLFIDNSCFPRNNQSPLALIEGIGSNWGILSNLGCSMYEINSLRCMRVDTLTYYPDSSTSCNLVTALNNRNIEIQNFSILPNPTNGFVKLVFQKRLKSIEIYNLQGQKVQEVSPNKRSWELPEQSGLYLIRMQDMNGNVYTEKVIRE